jgi:aminocarboxymuconate-semialdehyde decarboxylase
MKIDIHTHILPESWPDLAERFGYGGWVRLEQHEPRRARMMIGDRCFRVIEDNCWDPRRRIEDCDRTGVDVQVLSTVPVMFAYWAKPRDTRELSRLLNDHIASVCREHPRRFVGLGTVPLQDPQLACDELEWCVGELGLAGVEIGTHVGDWNLDEPALFPFFQQAERLGAAVFVHPWDMLAPERMKKYWLPWLVGMPTESALAICSLIFGGVLERLPRLRVCFAHGGGAFPALIGRIEQGFLARPDLCATDCRRNPREFLSRLYLDSCVHDADVLRLLIRLVGVERVALGSDYPFPLGEARPGALIESLHDLHMSDRIRLLSGTALEFIGRSPLGSD